VSPSVQKILRSRAVLRERNEILTEEVSVLARERKSMRAKTTRQREEIASLKKQIDLLREKIFEREDRMLGCRNCKTSVLLSD
jgi:peptidoglycan hydrolase CwlO-like protein